jgi:hypothetical protein
MSVKRASSIHPSLKNQVSYNVKTAMYEVRERETVYYLNFEQFSILNTHFTLAGTIVKDYSVEHWYDQLDRYTKKSISRSGNIKRED